MSASSEPAPIQAKLGASPSDWQIRAKSFAGRLKLELIRSARAHLLLTAVVLLYWAIADVVSQRLGVHQLSYLGVVRSGVEMLVVLYLGGLLIGYSLYVMVAVRPERLARYLWQGIASRGLTLPRMASILPVALLLPLVLSSYTSLKAAIPLINPYSWDPGLANFGRLLYGGHQAWEFLQPLMGHHFVTLLLNIVYNLWYFIVFIFIIWQITSMSRPRLRMQYLVTWVLQWGLLGNLLATLMPSVGPAFYSRLVGGPDPYAPLIQYLRSVDIGQALWAIKTQDAMWQCYADYGAQGACGISAMPSMHVAIAFSSVLLSFATNRWLGAVSAVFCALILIGSVHLGWHYASDGFVAIIGTWLIWRSVGWILDRPRVVQWQGIEPSVDGKPLT